MLRSLLEPYQRNTSPWLCGEEDALIFWEPYQCLALPVVFVLLPPGLTLLIRVDLTKVAELLRALFPINNKKYGRQGAVHKLRHPFWAFSDPLPPSVIFCHLLDTPPPMSDDVINERKMRCGYSLYQRRMDPILKSLSPYGYCVYSYFTQNIHMTWIYEENNSF